MGERSAREGLFPLEVRGEGVCSLSAGFSSPPWPWSPGPLVLPPQGHHFTGSCCWARSKAFPWSGESSDVTSLLILGARDSDRCRITSLSAVYKLGFLG